MEKIISTILVIVLVMMVAVEAVVPVVGFRGPVAAELTRLWQYLDNVSTSGGCAEKIRRTSLQPFEVFPYCSTTRNKSTGGMAASVGFPFTFAQWKELERQAMICKYMIASVPVPADLLFPLSRIFPDSSVTLAGGDGMYSARYSKKGDPEPGRCKHRVYNSTKRKITRIDEATSLESPCTPSSFDHLCVSSNLLS